MDLISKETIDRAAKSFFDFSEYMKFVHNWEPRPHQIQWIKALQLLADGKLTDASGNPTRKLMILAPPGSGKTDTMIEYASWVIGRATMNDEIPQVGYVCYSDDVAMVRSLAIRDTIEFSENYQLCFPAAQPLKDKRWAGHEWFLWRKDMSKKDPTFRGAGITGGILSYRFPTMIVIDDPHDPKNVKTAHQRDEIWRIWRTTVKTRAYEDTPIVLICTRWAEDDLPGRLIRVEKDWRVIHTPALNEMEESYWPAEKKTGMGFSTKSFLTMRIEDRESFLTQYMALPPSSIGDVFRWWAYGPRPVSQEIKRAYQSWDTAYTQRSYSSYSAMVEIIELKNGRCFISDVFRAKLEFPELLKVVAERYYMAEQRYGEESVMVLVENKASGGPIVAMLQQSLPPGHIKAVDLPTNYKSRASGLPPGQRDMLSRASAISKYFETSHVLIPEEWTEWKEDYLNEMKSFPRATNDDQVSATVLALEYIYPPRGMIDYNYKVSAVYEGWNYN